MGPPRYKLVYKPLYLPVSIVISTIKLLIKQLSYLGGPILYGIFIFGSPSAKDNLHWSHLQGIGQGLKLWFFIQRRSHQGVAIHFPTRRQWQFLMAHKEVRHHLAVLRLAVRSDAGSSLDAP